MCREAIWKSRHQVHQVSDQRRIMGKVGVQMVDRFFAAALLLVQDKDKAHSLKKTLPATARRITLIDAFIRSNIQQRSEIPWQMQHGDSEIFADQISPGPRRLSLQIMNGRLNLVYLPLNNVLMRVRQGKDLDRYTDLLQRQDLVQDKGL